MAKEIRKELTWSGKEKDVIYENGVKVGETRHETTWTGKSIDRTYNTRGIKVSETRHDTDWLGRPKDVTYVEGLKVSETRRDRTISGKPTEVIYQNGRKIGKLRRDDTAFGTKRKVLIEVDNDVDLTRRAVREKVKEDPDCPDRDLDYFLQARTRPRSEENIISQNNYSFWTLFFQGIAGFLGYLGYPEQEKKFLLRASEAYVCDGDFRLAARLAEQGGDNERAFHYYESAGLHDEAKRIGLHSGLRENVIKMLRLKRQYEEAAQIAEISGMIDEAIDLYKMEGVFGSRTLYNRIAALIEGAKLAEQHGMIHKALELYGCVNEYYKSPKRMDAGSIILAESALEREKKLKAALSNVK